MNELFEVRTKKFKKYYVLASGYDDAKRKVDEEIISDNSENILSLDGSLNTRFEIDEVEEIRKLGNKLIT